ncbi:MAG: isoprenylcysteine carboxylmethyltransferase family protein [Halopseudomonas sp.]
MSALELKIPPLLLVVIFVVVMKGVALLLPGARCLESFGLMALVILASAGAGIVIWGGLCFRRAKTTLDPTCPDTASSLVTSGVDRRTRNPMYLGFLLCLLGWGLFLANLLSLMLVGLFVVYMNRFQIEPEERALGSLFGVRFIEYKSRVRRWL